MTTEDGPVVHSYGRLIANGQVIMELSEIAPPENSTSSTGRITCTQGVWYWNNRKYNATVTDMNTSKTVYQDRSQGKASTLVVTRAWGKYANNIVYCNTTKTTATRRKTTIRLFPRGHGQ